MPERRSEDELSTRMRQQAAIADFGRTALEGMALESLGRHAVTVASRELGGSWVSLYEWLESDARMVRRAAVDDAGAPAESPSDAIVPIGSPGRPLGELRVAGSHPGSLSADDLHFLQGIANTLAASIVREQAEAEVRLERERLERALAQASEGEARFRELADSAPVLIWTADADGVVDFVNRRWRELTGRTLEQGQAGESWALGVHPADAEDVTDSWSRARRRRVPWEREYRLRDRDGEYRWIVDRGVPRLAGDRLVGWVGTATDIHERKEMEQKLARAAARDHEVAETLQRSLLPERLPRIDGVGLEARYLPASRSAAVGGDWYDAIELDDGRVGLVVGDVVGHGLRAATVMGQMRNAFRAYALIEGSPSDTLARMNRLLAREEQDVMATVLYVVLDRDSGEVRFASAGHPPALVVAGGEARFLEGGRAVPLGTGDTVSYREEAATLAPGSTLLLYTDGLIERRDTPLDDRLAQLAAVARVADGELGDVCDQLLGGVLGGLRPADDVALLAVRPGAVAAGALSLRLPADPGTLVALRRRLERFLQCAEASERESSEITLAVSEAAMNAIEHAYGPDDADFEVDARADGGQVEVCVRDSGAWRERRGSDRGRGLAIIDGLMDDAHVERSAHGTTVTMRRRLVDAATRARPLYGQGEREHLR